MPRKKPELTQKAVRAARAREHVPHPGLKFSHKHHVFIAKPKRGELWALNHLSVPARAALTPLFEMFPPSAPRKNKDGKTSKPQKPLPTHANDLLMLINNEWALPFFMDTRFVATGGVPSPAAVKTFFDTARNIGVAAVPVTSIRFAAA
jgi:hypothetical protein